QGNDLARGSRQGAGRVALSGIRRLFLVRLVNDEVVEEALQLFVNVLGGLKAPDLASERPQRLFASDTLHLPLGELGGVEVDASVVHLLGAAPGTTYSTFPHAGPHRVRRPPLRPELGPVAGDDVLGLKQAKSLSWGGRNL